MKTLFFSDMHADAITGGFERFDDARVAALLVTDRARELSKREPVRVYFLGDFCDPDHVPTVIRSIRLMLFIVQILTGDGIESFWMTGNHDVIEDGRGSSTLDPIGMTGASLIKEPMVIGDTLFLPYTASAFTYDPAAECRKVVAKGFTPKLIVAHLMVEGMEQGSESDDFSRGRDLMLPLDVIDELWPGVRIVIGHYHRRQTHRYRAKSGRTVEVEVVGSLLRLTRAEAANQPCILEIDT